MKPRAAYQPTVNRIELPMIATKKFGIQASKIGLPPEKWSSLMYGF